MLLLIILTDWWFCKWIKDKTTKLKWYLFILVPSQLTLKESAHVGWTTGFFKRTDIWVCLRESGRSTCFLGYMWYTRSFWPQGRWRPLDILECVSPHRTSRRYRSSGQPSHNGWCRSDPVVNTNRRQGTIEHIKATNSSLIQPIPFYNSWSLWTSACTHRHKQIKRRSMIQKRTKVH